MGVDLELVDPSARNIWPAFLRFACKTRPDGYPDPHAASDKWVPWHSVLCVHELFIVKEVHGAEVPWWEDYHRFMAMLLFRVHCRPEVFRHVQAAFLRERRFWTDLRAGFSDKSDMHEALMQYRFANGRGRARNVLQTSDFRIIPTRLVDDDDENLVLNILLRSRRIIDMAEKIWPLLNDADTTVDEKYDLIRDTIQGFPTFGHTWVKMLMVTIDHSRPHMELLRNRCEVGIGAMAPLQELLGDERPARKVPVRKRVVNGSATARASKDTSVESLADLLSKVNASRTCTAEHFWLLLRAVEASGREHFRQWRLILAQLSTESHCMSASTLQVQLCEFRQFLERGLAAHVRPSTGGEAALVCVGGAGACEAGASAQKRARARSPPKPPSPRSPAPLLHTERPRVPATVPFRSRRFQRDRVGTPARPEIVECTLCRSMVPQSQFNEHQRECFLAAREEQGRNKRITIRGLR